MSIDWIKQQSHSSTPHQVYIYSIYFLNKKNSKIRTLF